MVFTSSLFCKAKHRMKMSSHEIKIKEEQIDQEENIITPQLIALDGIFHCDEKPEKTNDSSETNEVFYPDVRLEVSEEEIKIEEFEDYSSQSFWPKEECDWRTESDLESNKDLNFSAGYHNPLFDSKKFQCSTCLKAFQTQVYLDKHLLIHSPLLFQCSICSFKTKRKDYLRIHQLNHSGIKRFKCDKCSFGTNIRSRLTSHTKMHAEVKLLKCSKCNYETTLEDNLKLHELVHSEERCVLGTEGDLQNNEDANHRMEMSCQGIKAKEERIDQEEDIGTMQLIAFDGIFHFDETDKNDLAETSVVFHSDVKLEVSEQEVGIEKLENYNSHSFCSQEEYMLRTEGDSQDNKDSGFPVDFLNPLPDSKKFRCFTCLKTFQTKMHLNKHLLIHSALLYQCPICHFTTKRKDYLRAHQLNHSETKRFKCDKCAFGTNIRSRLTVHEKVHAEVKLFKCLNCKYETTRKDNLKLHELTHSKILVQAKYRMEMSCQEIKIMEERIDQEENISATRLITVDGISVYDEKVEETNDSTETNEVYYPDVQLKVSEKVVKIEEFENYSSQNFSTKNEYEFRTEGDSQNNRLGFSGRNSQSSARFQEIPMFCLKIFQTKVHLNKHLLIHSTLLYQYAICNFTTKRKDYMRAHHLNHSETK